MIAVEHDHALMAWVAASMMRDRSSFDDESLVFGGQAYEAAGAMQLDPIGEALEVLAANSMAIDR
jgi:hypothetical protein